MNVATPRGQADGCDERRRAAPREQGMGGRPRSTLPLGQERAMADAEEGRCLLAALRSAVHVHMGFGSFGEYIERLFGYGRRCTQEKLRVAEALEGLPRWHARWKRAR